MSESAGPPGKFPYPILKWETGGLQKQVTCSGHTSRSEGTAKTQAHTSEFKYYTLTHHSILCASEMNTMEMAMVA